jgi:hypothetical protein
VTNGALLALVADASFSWGDGYIKALGGELSVFEVGFFSTLFAACFLVFGGGGERCGRRRPGPARAGRAGADCRGGRAAVRPGERRPASR